MPNPEPDPVSLTALIYSAIGGAVTFGFAWLLKRTRPAEALTPQEKLIVSWQQVADDAQAELAECRVERQRQDARITGLQQASREQRRDLEQLSQRFGELRTEVNQWRDGRRVPDGFRLQRIEDNGGRDRASGGS